jgi:hypothetical protein
MKGNQTHTKKELFELCKNASKSCMGTQGSFYIFAIPGVSIQYMYNTSNREFWLVIPETGFARCIGYTDRVYTRTEFELASKNAMKNSISLVGGVSVKHLKEILGN